MNRTSSPSQLRCAIYTRKSSEEGLDQSFNSLHAQREACEAYVLSQAGEGWSVVKTTYDDGGLSGGSIERPALRRLLADIDGGQIDIVVVYKVDRLTRSLTDFAKIVEAFDRRSVSFVSVTQAFNTTTSMGRLTLNVLLSFAQFEREVTCERIRDKIAASKAKGMWMGGKLPLGYDPPVDATSRALVVNVAEARTVRLIFDRYLALGTVHALQRWLADKEIYSKAWVSSRGREIGGRPFNHGGLSHLLRNRIYLGEIIHRDRSYRGAHPPIVATELFDAAQTLLAPHARRRRQRAKRASMVLKGLLFDADGSPMNPSFGYGAKGQLYRYYVSLPLHSGRVSADPNLIRRVPASIIEDLVQDCLQRLARRDDPDIRAVLHRAEVHPNTVQLVIRRAAFFCRPGDPVEELFELERRTDCGERLAADVGNPEYARVTVPRRLRFRCGRIQVTDQDGRPISKQPRPDATLIKALRTAHVMFAESAGVPVGALDRASLDVAPTNTTYQRMIARLAFLAPDVQAQILDGRQPPELNLQRLMQTDLPAAWQDQRRLLLGLSKP